MTDSRQLVTKRRAADRPEWSGLVPEQLFTRLSGEPVIGDAVCELGDALLTSIDGRMLELIALRVSAARSCLYVWSGHCAIALRRPDGALTPDEIACVAVGPSALSGSDAALVQGVDDLLSHGQLGARTREAIGGNALALGIATCFYDMVTMIMSGAPPDAPPIPGLETPSRAVATRASSRRVP